MDYIVMDLEWNQPADSQENTNKELPSEIIEIGAVKLNEKREVQSTFSQIIKPSVYREINYITKKLVHIDTEELNNGRDFVPVMEEFLKWCGQDYMFCTWGTLDLSELQRNMSYYHMEQLSNKPFPYYDIQKLFSICYEDSKSRRALEYAVDYLQIEKNDIFHRAQIDAYYTAMIFQKINNPDVMQKVSFDVYHIPKCREDEIYIVFDNYAKYITREFMDKTEAMKDKQVSAMKCYLCNKNVKRRMRWFTPNGKHFYGIGECDVHGLIKYKVRMKRSDGEKVYVVKTSKIASEEDIQEVKEKQERVRILRKIRRKKNN